MGDFASPLPAMAPHNYADDGVYTVTIRLADDNMGAFVDGRSSSMREATASAWRALTSSSTTFTVTVHNVAPVVCAGQWAADPG